MTRPTRAQLEQAAQAELDASLDRYADGLKRAWARAHPEQAAALGITLPTIADLPPRFVGTADEFTILGPDGTPKP
jgi:hypothetical protein